MPTNHTAARLLGYSGPTVIDSCRARNPATFPSPTPTTRSAGAVHILVAFSTPQPPRTGRSDGSRLARFSRNRATGGLRRDSVRSNNLSG
jgi:hypothetical protein